MTKVQAFSDKFSISLSVLCALHCLFAPVLMVVLPSVLSTWIVDENFHLGLVMIVIPVSLMAFFVGCKKHKGYSVLAAGVAGMAFLVSALLFGHEFGESGEKVLTLIGAAILALAHALNYRRCKSAREASCACH